MKTLLVSLALLLVATSASAFCDDWRTADTVLLTSALVVTEVDREQTQWMVSQPRAAGYYEKYNTFTGSQPSAATVNMTFAVETVAAVAAACVLPNPYRDLFFVGWIGVEYSVVHHNTATVGTPTPLLGMHLSF